MGLHPRLQLLNNSGSHYFQLRFIRLGLFLVGHGDRLR
jgi:hypothetical protein